MTCPNCENYGCKKYGEKCLAYFKNTEENEGIDKGILEKLSCYKESILGK